MAASARLSARQYIDCSYPLIPTLCLSSDPCVHPLCGAAITVFSDRDNTMSQTKEFTLPDLKAMCPWPVATNPWFDKACEKYSVASTMYYQAQLTYSFIFSHGILSMDRFIQLFPQQQQQAKAFQELRDRAGCILRLSIRRF